MKYVKTYVTSFEEEPYVAHIYEHMLVNALRRRLFSNSTENAFECSLHAVTFNSHWILFSIKSEKEDIISELSNILFDTRFEKILSEFDVSQQESRFETFNRFPVSDEELKKRIRDVHKRANWINYDDVKSFDYSDVSLKQMRKDLEQQEYPTYQARLALTRPTAKETMLLLLMMPPIEQYFYNTLQLKVPLYLTNDALFYRTPKGQRCYIGIELTSDADKSEIETAFSETLEETKQFTKKILENVLDTVNTQDWHDYAIDIFSAGGIMMPRKKIKSMCTIENIDALLSTINVELS